MPLNEEPLELLDHREARHWTEAYPVGNGHRGAMHYGGAVEEHLQLNEDTLWTGLPAKWKNPESRKGLAAVRQALDRGEWGVATDLSKKIQSHYVASYLPFGDLRLAMGHGAEVQGYARTLDLRSAVSSVTYRVGDRHYRRELIASYPDEVLAFRLSCVDGEGRPAPGLSFSVELTSPLQHVTATREKSLLLSGIAPREADCHDKVVKEAEDGRAMGFAALLQVLSTDGELGRHEKGLDVKGASEVVFTLAMATSFKGPRRMPGFGPALAVKRVTEVAQRINGRDWAALLERHLADWRGLFDRVTFSLAGPAADGRPTRERIAGSGAGDPGLVRLLFHYGRYLLIAGSRPGSQPTNLQGIWNDRLVPPWNSNYTTNINTEMNYWPAEVCGLSECAEPLFDFIGDLSVRGRHAAGHFLGCRGWTAFHNSDLWRQAEPGGNYGNGRPQWALWPMAGAWLCQHLHEHWLYTGDRAFLRKRAWPLMKGAAEFALDWLVEKDGVLFTSPSTSPENTFYDEARRVCEVAMASGMDLGILRDLFTRCVDAAETLGIEGGFRRRIRAALAKLKPLAIGPDGRLLEYHEPFPEVDPKHRHVSHLYALHPAALVTREGTPDLFAAARKTLEARGDGGTGWSMAWKVNFWARLKDGDRALGMIRNFMVLVDPAKEDYKGGGLYPNLFDAHPPFQIDGNYGVTAGMVEMLVQSHEGFIDLLPALPGAWTHGEVSGIRLRGGFEMAMTWAGGRVSEVTFRSLLGSPLVIRSKHPLSGPDAGTKKAEDVHEYRVATKPGDAVRFTAG